MEDLYKDDPNSWLRHTRFSKTVYHQPDPLQIPIIPLTKLKLGSSNPSSNRDNTSQTAQTTILPSLKSNNPDSGLTSEVQVKSDSKTEKNKLASMHGAISGMFKEVKNAVRSPFMGPPHRERIVKSPSSQNKKSRQMKYFDREVCQVGVLDKSSEDDWTPDMSELIRWKKMVSRVCCPIFKEDHVGPPESSLKD